MIAEVLQQIFLGGTVFGEDDDFFIHFTDQLHRFLRFCVRLDGTDALQQLHHPLTLRRIGRKLLDQVDQCNEYGITAAANFTLKRHQREHAAEIPARFLILVFDKSRYPVI
ncbi:hypothetical protein D3C72_2043490 [compost metagenome]